MPRLSQTRHRPCHGGWHATRCAWADDVAGMCAALWPCLLDLFELRMLNSTEPRLGTHLDGSALSAVSPLGKPQRAEV